MATCRVIVNAALRKLGVLGSGREPRATDATDALDGLKALYRSMINAGAFSRLRDVVPITDYTANENERVFRNHSEALTITLPELVSRNAINPRPYDRETPTYSDPLTLTTSRPPLDCSVVVIVDAFTGITADFIYDGHTKKWQSLYDLTVDSNAPLSFRDELGLASLLATTLADQFGADLTDTTTAAARIFQSGLINRWSMPAQVVPGTYM